MVYIIELKMLSNLTDNILLRLLVGTRVLKVAVIIGLLRTFGDQIGVKRDMQEF